MRLAVGLLACVYLGQFSQALAAEPQTDHPSIPGQPAAAAQSAAQPGDAPAPVAPASASGVSPTAKSPPVVAATGATPAKSDDSVNAAEDKRLRALGYKPEIRNDKKYYCRREAPLGSRFETKICGTAEQLSSVRQSGKEALEEAQRHRITQDGH